MELNDALKMSCYRVIGELNPTHGVELVRHTETGKICVRKTLGVYNRSVYAYLKAYPVRYIPIIYDYAEEDGRLTVIEEYVPGESLQELMGAGKRFTEKEAADIVIRLCRIIGELHAADPPIIHRDVKPSNVLLTPEGNVFLLDMNAAKRSGSGKDCDTELLGTVGYAAPEQYGFSESDVKTDIYALGVLLNVLVTGTQPQIEVPSGKIGKIIQKCTKMDPEKRYKSVKQLADALGLCIGQKNGTHAVQKHPLALPGFRQGKPLYMVLAGLGYLMLFTFVFTLEMELPALESVFVKAGLFAIFLITVLFYCNYGGIQEELGFFRIRKKFWRIAAIVFSGYLIIALGIFFISLIAVAIEEFTGAL